ncbi:hypothetical protein ACFXTH_017527 [Malus domestica]
MMHATCSNANPPQEPTRCWCSNAEKCDCGKRMGEDAGLLANFESAERVNINKHFLSLLTSSSSLRGSQQALRPAILIVQRSSHDPLSAAIARSITSCIANTPNLNLSHTILNQIGIANTNFPDSTFLLGQASAASDDNWFQNETRIDLWRQLLMESTLYMHRPPDSLLEGPTSFFVVTASHGVNFSMNAEAIFQRPLHFSIEMRNHSGAMWPDVDNMSYEELLALEDRIGYVSTGLSEEVAVKSLKRSHYFVFTEENTQKDFCSICQEDFVEEDELGTLDCGHGFHISCIKQWLGYKNVCPMCKSPGISTTLPSFSHIQSP